MSSYSVFVAFSLLFSTGVGAFVFHRMLRNRGVEIEVNIGG